MVWASNSYFYKIIITIEHAKDQSGTRREQAKDQVRNGRWFSLELEKYCDEVKFGIYFENKADRIY
jgi:hypothetical protein